MTSIPIKRELAAGLILGALASSVLMSSARAQDVGDAARGLKFAQTNCASCHGLERQSSPREESPPFHVIANTPGMTALALKVWFQTPHPNMPNFMLAREDRDDVIAYIESLKSSQ